MEWYRGNGEVWTTLLIRRSFAFCRWAQWSVKGEYQTAYAVNVILVQNFFLCLHLHLHLHPSLIQSIFVEVVPDQYQFT